MLKKNLEDSEAEEQEQEAIEIEMKREEEKTQLSLCAKTCTNQLTFLFCCILVKPGFENC